MGANESSEIDPNKRERSIPTLELAKKSAQELCFARMSIRSYDESKSIDSTTLEAIQMFLKDPIKMTFPKEGSKAQRIELLCKDEAVKGKLGTYGIISGAKYFLVGITESEESSLEIGFVFERLVLLCTSLGLGTCWIGGTFNKSQFKANLTLNEHEQIFAVSPIGYPLDKERLMGRAFASISGHNNRKPFNQICFKGLNYDENNGFESPESVGPIGIALEAARWSPSAVNSQPWRLFVQPNKD
ncbi:MAG: putative nitroreductase like, partial [Streblomastix strix]